MKELVKALVNVTACAENLSRISYKRGECRFTECQWDLLRWAMKFSSTPSLALKL